MKSSLLIASPLLLCAALVCSRPAWAQTSTSDTPANPLPTVARKLPPSPSVLSIALPSQARLRLDIDARDKEVLGVVKSLLDGFDAAGGNLRSIIPQPVVPQSSTSTPSRDLDNAAALQLLSDPNLYKLLVNITHLRAVVMEMPDPRRSAGKRGARVTGSPQSVLSFYEQAYIVREGGHRILRADFDDVQLLTVGFEDKGFALVVQAPGMGVVLRSDGYPNLEGVGPLAMAMFLRFAPKPQ